jgi:hypothetical protein
MWESSSSTNNKVEEQKPIQINLFIQGILMPINGMDKENLSVRIISLKDAFKMII